MLLHIHEGFLAKTLWKQSSNERLNPLTDCGWDFHRPTQQSRTFLAIHTGHQAAVIDSVIQFNISDLLHVWIIPPDERAGGKLDDSCLKNYVKWSPRLSIIINVVFFEKFRLLLKVFHFQFICRLFLFFFNLYRLSLIFEIGAVSAVSLESITFFLKCICSSFTTVSTRYTYYAQDGDWHTLLSRDTFGSRNWTWDKQH